MERVEAFIYPLALALISLFVLVLEALFPWRKDQPLVRRWSFAHDLVHLVFNGHFLGLLLFGVARTHLLPWFDAFLAEHGLTETVYRNAASEWPLWVQIPLTLIVVDFFQWAIHVLLHRTWLWEVHKSHHSIRDGEMSWIASFRYQWTEIVAYSSLLYLPLAFFGFSSTAVLVHAIFGTLIGHLNHANLNTDFGPLRYIFNSPRMHIWHHDYEGDAKTTVNFGIIFSTWDWIFGTATIPDEPPAKLGFVGVETYPRDFLSQTAWPLSAWEPLRSAAPLLGVGIIGLGIWLHVPRGAAEGNVAPMFGEEAATSQPARSNGDLLYPASRAEATAALAHFGRDARAAGYAHPEWMLSAPELAAALGADGLQVLDVRPRDRFAAGHIPGAHELDRGDYSASAPIPGLSLDAAALSTMLRDRGVEAGDKVVIVGEGPEAYRIWWTLRTLGGLETRVLDGGVVRWGELGGTLAVGPGVAPEPGDIELAAHAPAPDWGALDHHATFIDARTPAEYSGAERHRSAARAGHIPGATLWPYEQALRSEDDPRLRSPEELRSAWDALGTNEAVVYCQSGTRSSLALFGFLEAGVSETQLQNYDGSWAEYSRLPDAPASCPAC